MTDISSIGYTRKWIEYGVVNVSDIENDIASWLRDGKIGDDHYRLNRIIHYINGKGILLSITEINEILEIARDDCDGCMSQVVIIYLLQNDHIDDAAYKQLLIHPLVQIFDFSRLIERHSVLRTIKANGLSSDVIARSINSKDSYLQKEILKMDGLAHHWLECFIKHGYSKQIRNIAKRYRGDKGFKKTAQQVDSAEASTIAVPPSDLSGSPR